MSDASKDNETGELHGIGAVSERTGLSTAVIRMWEKRYGAVTPQRTPTNRRLFSREDVERLVLMKRLTGCGHAIGQIAGLGLDQLEAMWEGSGVRERAMVKGSQQGPRRILLIGPSAETWIRQLDIGGIDLAVWEGDLEGLDPAMPLRRAELVVIETDTLFAETAKRVREVMDAAGALRAVMIYRFAGRGVMETVEALGDDLVMLRGPLSVARLQRECLLQIKSIFPAFGDPLPAEAGPIPAKRFNASQLARLATVSSSIDCECPRHMAELLKNLSAFEAYSDACEDRNEDDALVHGYLHRTTARVRRTMENALAELLKAEGVEL